jgi:hypothetical protein
MGYTYNPQSDLHCASRLEWAREWSLDKLERGLHAEAAAMLAEAELTGGGSIECHQVPGGVRGSYRLTSPAASLRTAPGLRVFAFVADPFLRFQHGAAQELVYVRRSQRPRPAGEIVEIGRELIKLTVLRIAGRLADECLGGSRVHSEHRWRPPDHAIPQAWHLRATLGSHPLRSLTHLEGREAPQNVTERLLREANLTSATRAGRRAARLTPGTHGVNSSTSFPIWRQYSRGERMLLCRVLRWDYLCLGYASPEECRSERIWADNGH